jgi:hypothetical protein
VTARVIQLFLIARSICVKGIARDGPICIFLAVIKLSMLCPTEQQSGVTLFAAVLLEDFILVDFTVDEPIKKHLDV